MNRFTITSTAANGRTTTRRCDHVVEAWDWYAYFTKTARTTRSRSPIERRHEP